MSPQEFFRKAMKRSEDEIPQGTALLLESTSHRLLLKLHSMGPMRTPRLRARPMTLFYLATPLQKGKNTDTRYP